MIKAGTANIRAPKSGDIANAITQHAAEALQGLPAVRQPEECRQGDPGEPGRHENAAGESGREFLAKSKPGTTHPTAAVQDRQKTARAQEGLETGEKPCAPARARNEGAAPSQSNPGFPVADAAAAGAAPLAFWKPLADLPRMLEEITTT